jgi:hypothetical protein
MALKTDNLPSDDLKCDMGYVDEAMFRVVERPFERIFTFWAIKKAILTNWRM